MAVYVNNITVNTGENFYRDFYLDNIDGTPLDLTGYTGKSEVRKHPDSVGAATTFTLSFVDRTNGRFRLSLDRYVTEKIKPGRYFYDVMFTDSSNKKSIVVEGMFNAREDYTPISECLITYYPGSLSSPRFGGIPETGQLVEFYSGYKEITIDQISDYGVVHLGHFHACGDVSDLEANLTNADYLQKITNYISLGGVIWFNHEHTTCGNVVSSNNALTLLGTSIRVGSASLVGSASNVLTISNSFPATWRLVASGAVIGGTKIYEDGPTISMAYERIGNGIVIVSADTNGTHAELDQNNNEEVIYNAMRDLVLRG